ncbi:unnamed protein product [Bursaphelenchus xylophilus]|uniref:(pine wood nematode) hypothetical protein n=1 Tax=Bursaphelenchus xylophilus TaxID=6326 RepID=A0A1I7S9Q1_BURXY|nr:unnamed protein product [Bursaphelenchus xylophilus]CAG9129158.1 unnamed protein product [Bursaphelenchus xylophilus]
MEGNDTCEGEVNNPNVVNVMLGLIGTLVGMFVVMAITLGLFWRKLLKDLARIRLMQHIISNLEPDPIDVREPLPQEPSTGYTGSTQISLADPSSNGNNDYEEDLRVFERFRIRVRALEKHKKDEKKGWLKAKDENQGTEMKTGFEARRSNPKTALAIGQSEKADNGKDSGGREKGRKTDKTGPSSFVEASQIKTQASVLNQSQANPK